MGKKQELRRKFRTISTIGFTSCVMGTWAILLTANTQGLTAGGLAGLFWSLCWAYAGRSELALLYLCSWTHADQVNCSSSCRWRKWLRWPQRFAHHSSRLHCRYFADKQFCIGRRSISYVYQRHCFRPCMLTARDWVSEFAPRRHQKVGVTYCRWLICIASLVALIVVFSSSATVPAGCPRSHGRASSQSTLTSWASWSKH